MKGLAICNCRLPIGVREQEAVGQKAESSGRCVQLVGPDGFKTGNTQSEIGNWQLQIHL